MKINKVIQRYLESILFGLSLRQMVFALLAIGVAGGAYVIRNMVSTEGIFVANDYWRGIKQNFGVIGGALLLYSIFFVLSNISSSHG